MSLGAGPYQTAILVTVTTAVLFSVLVQGLTLERLIRALSLERRPMADRIGRDEGLRTAMRRGSRETPELKRGGRFSSRPGASKGAGLEDDLRRLRDEIEGAARSTTEADQERSLLLMRCFQVEREFFDDVFAKAHLSERAYRDLRYSVTLQSLAVRYNDPLPKATLHSGPTFDFFEFQRRGRILNDYETAWGRFQASSYILGVLDDLAAQVLTPDEIRASVREIYQGWQSRAQKRVDGVADHFPDYVNRMQERMADRLAAQAESEVVENRARDGSIPSRAADAQSQALVKAIRSLRGGTPPIPKVDPVEILEKSVFFNSLPRAELERIAAHLRPRTIPDYQFVPNSGADGNSIFVIARGIVHGFQPKADNDGPAEVWGPGDIFGNTSIVGRKAKSIKNRAMSPSYVFALRIGDLEALASACPELSKALDQARGT